MAGFEPGLHPAADRFPSVGRRAAVRADDDADERAAALYRAYRSRGGVASGDEVAAALRPHSAQPISTLARWIVARRVLSFNWRCQTLIPLFQFDLARMALRDGVQEVIAELAVALDEQELADWFVQPNAWLAGAAPADRVEHDVGAVLDAARAGRFVAWG